MARIEIELDKLILVSECAVRRADNIHFLIIIQLTYSLKTNQRTNFIYEQR